MIQENDILLSLKKLYHRVGTQSALAELAGITQSTINAYLNGRAKIENMPLGVFLRLFRDMKIDFFGGKSASKSNDLLQAQLLDIFNGLSDADKLRCITIVAANFGGKIREETRG